MAAPCTDYVVTLGNSSGNPCPVSDERLVEAFSRLLLWRRSLARGVVPIECATGTSAPLFPTGGVIAALEGTGRSLTAQTSLCYAGLSGGHDALGHWSIAPLGRVFGATIARADGVQGPWSLKDLLPCRVQGVKHLTEPAVHLTPHEVAMESHKLTAFVSWMEARFGEGTWDKFPEQHVRNKVKRDGKAAKPFLSPVARSIVLAMVAPGPMHRGFLLYGPAGTGKSHLVTQVMRYLALESVSGRDEDGGPAIGSGAELKGSLQGDLEMKIYAVFGRPQAAPWLTFAISVDEIDFTAPSRRFSSSQDSGGNLWLYKLSDGLRPRNATFLATTNVVESCLEQLVDRLTKRYVGLLPWKQHVKLVEDKLRHWPKELFHGASNAKDCIEKKLYDGLHTPWYAAVLLGATPRMLGALLTFDDIDAVQVEKQPWPTLTYGALSLRRLLVEHPPSDDDCRLLYDFLSQAKLTGRLLIDTSRLRERLIIVEVEVILTRHSKEAPWHEMKSTIFNHVVHVPPGYDGRCITRTFVLQKQESEAKLWGVLAKLAVIKEADSCLFASEELLSTTTSSASQQSADDRHRDAIKAATHQFVTQCSACVFVLPLRYARIHRSSGDTLGSSTIHAHEVWDTIMDLWKVNQHSGGPRFFALYATESWEVEAVTTHNATMAWPVSPFRQHCLDRKQDNQLCVVCNMSYSLRNPHDKYGCQHAADDKVVAMRKQNNAQEKPETLKMSDFTSAQEDYMRLNAKWLCCGRPFLEDSCTKRVHRCATRWEDEEPLAQVHCKSIGWWCNQCGQKASAEKCF